MNDDTTKKLDELLMAAMRAEAEAKKFYADAASKAGSQAGRGLFTELADFEQGHYDRLQKIIEARGQGMKIDVPSAAQSMATKAEVEGEFEPNKDEVIKVLTIGIEAEKKAQDKYLEIARMFDDPSSKAIFTALADEERKHQNILENQFYSMSNKGRIIWGE